MTENSSIPTAIYADLEYRGRYIVQEAWKLAQRAHRVRILPEDLELAYSTFGSAPMPPVWVPKGSEQARLVQTSGPLKPTPMSLVGGVAGGGGGGPDLSTLAGSRSEARSLAEITITLKAALEGATMDSIRALIAQLSAPASPSSLLRAVVATVRAELEALLLVAPTPTPTAPTPGTTTTTTSLPRLQTILSSLLNTPTLPLEECAGEFLALSVTLAVHTPHHASQPSSSSSSSSTSMPPPTPADVAFREAAALCAAGYVGRFGRVWPEVEVQAVGLLLDAAVEASLSPGESGGSGSGSGSGSGASGSGSAGPVVTLQSPAALFGALSTLAILPSLPSQHRPLVGKLAGLLEGHWEGGGSSSRAAWEEETKRMLSRVRKAHSL